MANGQHDESRGPIERASRVFPLRLLHTEPARCGCGCGSGYLQCGSPDIHAALERAKLLLGQQIEHLVIGVYHETHMILVIVDPYFMPFAAIQSVEQSREAEKVDNLVGFLAAFISLFWTHLRCELITSSLVVPVLSVKLNVN